MPRTLFVKKLRPVSQILNYVLGYMSERLSQKFLCLHSATNVSYSAYTRDTISSPELDSEALKIEQKTDIIFLLKARQENQSAINHCYN